MKLGSDEEAIDVSIEEGTDTLDKEGTNASGEEGTDSSDKRGGHRQLGQRRPIEVIDISRGD